MKTWILAMAMMAGVTMTAQPNNREKFDHKRPGREQRDPFTPEQRTELKVKHLTLALDLTDKQQKEMQKLFLNQNKEKEQFMALHKANKDAGKKPTVDERFAMQTKRLDAQIATQREIKKILTAEQFTKFEQLKEKEHDRMQKGRHGFKREHNKGPRK